MNSLILMKRSSWCSGYDAPFHLSEECSNANIASPRAIVLTSGIGGLMGWFLQLVVAYTVIDIDGVISSELGQPWASYLLQVLPQQTALAALSLTIITAFMMGQGNMVAPPRVTFAYARDGLLSILQVDLTRKYTDPHTCQCSVVECLHWNPTDLAHIRWPSGCWCPLLHRGCRCLCGVHHPYLHPSLPCGKSIPTRTLEFGKIQHANWGGRFCICDPYGAHSNATEHYGS